MSEHQHEASSAAHAALRQRPGDQQLPVTADPTAPGMHDIAIALLRERKALGLTRYGTTLQPFNGRDALQDALEEVTDLLVYLLQVRQERDDPQGAAQLAAARDEARDQHERDLAVIREIGWQIRAEARAGRTDEVVHLTDRLRQWSREPRP